MVELFSNFFLSMATVSCGRITDALQGARERGVTSHLNIIEGMRANHAGRWELNPVIRFHEAEEG